MQKTTQILMSRYWINLKILDRYILGQYLKTFISVFIVLLFILILQAIWLYIKEIAGKDLDAATIFKFLYYNIPIVIPIALPLSVLLAAILVFGNLAENYEFAAMKANGISLQRAMRSLAVVIGVIGITSFGFANYVIPWGQLKQKNLRNNIAKLKPAMAISEGVFNQLGEFNIRVEKKSGENGKFLEDVIIHKKSKKRSGNFTVIKSKTGELKSSLNSNVIQLVLYEGNYYDDLILRDFKKMQNLPFVKSYFDSYTINIDVSQINQVDLESEAVTDNHKMLRIHELKERIDTFEVNVAIKNKDYFDVQYSKWAPEQYNKVIGDGLDTLEMATTGNKNFFDQLTPQLQIRAIENVERRLFTEISSIRNRVAQDEREHKLIASHEVQIHKKYVLGAACIILFFIGAPLGAIIRKGGMGLPLVIATIFFLAYWFIGLFAEKSAQEGVFPAWFGAWMSTLIIFPIGLLLTYRATTDRGLLDLSSAWRPFFGIFKKLKKSKAPKA
ncbi:MAG: LptF/LptG family permease [Nonlabens sp.]